MDSYTCPTWLTVWTLGQTGPTCLHSSTGVRFGKDSLRTLGLQIHWNNAKKRTDLFDNSGFRIFYTSKLRPHDLGHVQIGQNDIEIPAKSSQSHVTGSCSESCTRNILRYPVYLTMTSLHMHHLGARAHFGVYRNGTLIRTVANDDKFQYSSSSIHVHRPEVEVHQGDEVRMECWFTNPGNDTVHWGKGSGEEMCYAFVSYYPEIPGFAQCVQFGQYDTCLPNATDPSQIGTCHMSTFYKNSPKILQNILSACHNSDDEKLLCSKKCRHVIRAFLSHDCMQGRLGKYFMRVEFPDMAAWKKVQDVIALQC